MVLQHADYVATWDAGVGEPVVAGVLPTLVSGIRTCGTESVLTAVRGQPIQPLSYNA